MKRKDPPPLVDYSIFSKKYQVSSFLEALGRNGQERTRNSACWTSAAWFRCFERKKERKEGRSGGQPGLGARRVQNQDLGSSREKELRGQGPTDIMTDGE